MESDAYYAGAVDWGYRLTYNGGTYKGDQDRISFIKQHPAWFTYGRIVVGKAGCQSDGSKSGVFDPDNEIKRAEFVTMLWRMAGEPIEESVINGKASEMFSDVKVDDYFYPAAIWAEKHGISNGTGEDPNNPGKYLFSPNSNCTRAQAITFLYRYDQNVGVKQS